MSKSTEKVGVPRMSPNPPDHFKIGRTILLSFAFAIVLLLWNYFNFEVPQLLLEFLPGRQSLIGLIMALDNIIAVLLQPVFGNVSDRTKSRFGRRMPYIFLGTIISAILFVFFPFARYIWGLVGLICAFDLAMALYRSASVAIVADYTLDKFRAKASGLQQFISNLGGVVSFVIPSLILMLPTNMHRSFGFILVSVLMITLLLVLVFTIKETPTGTRMIGFSKDDFDLNPQDFTIREKEHEEKIGVFTVFKEIFTQKDKSMLYTILFVFFTYLGFAAIEPFVSLFGTEFLFSNLPTAEAKAAIGNLTLVYSGCMILTAIVHGWLGQKLGRKRCVIIGLAELGVLIIMMIIYSIPMARNGNTIPIYVNMGLIGVFWMMVIVNTFPIVWSLAPPGQIGSYTGVYYTFNQLAYTLSPVIMGAILQLFANRVWIFNPGQEYVMLFPYIFICMMIALVFVLFIKGGEAKLTQEKVEEYTGKYVQND
jgi:maltose/moltooligosaccharide transporter